MIRRGSPSTWRRAAGAAIALVLVTSACTGDDDSADEPTDEPTPNTNGGGHHSDNPTPQEDEPGWNCETMGNHKCAPELPHTGGEGLVLTALIGLVLMAGGWMLVRKANA